MSTAGTHNNQNSSSLQPTWLEQPLPHGLGEKLQKRWQSGSFLAIAGAHDPLAGLLARKAGFEALYLSGAALTASLGLPDLGLVTMEELVTRARAIVRVTRLPLLVDGDTGYGEILNVMRLVRELEDAGVAAVQLEDQVLPKKCGHLNGKQLVSAAEMAKKISAAARARQDLKIVARTDAVAQEGMAAAIARARSYVAAGADAIFPEALHNEAEFREFATAIDVPLLANMTEFGKTEQFSFQQFAEFGYAMAIWPVSGLRIAARALEDFYQQLHGEETAAGTIARMQPRAELYETINYYGYESLDAGIERTELPG